MDTVQQRKIGRYELLEEIGRGAVGTVYRAQDPLTRQTFAVKVFRLPAGLSPEQSGAVRERFLGEAQAAGSLTHPNVVKIHEAAQEEESGDLYLVMEWVPGKSLDRLMKEEAPSRERVLEIMGQLASALDAAHTLGIVHGDIKPSSVLFTEERTAKITGFVLSGIDTSLATQGAPDLGTSSYVSPEQASGIPLDGRADLFSLGAMCYQLLAGRPAFEGKSAAAVAYQIVHSTPPPISGLAMGLPPTIDAVMGRVLAKDPAQRHASGREFHEDLRSALEAPPSPAAAVLPRDLPPAPEAMRPRAMGWRWALWGTAVPVAILLLALWIAGGGGNSEAPEWSKPGQVVAPAAADTEAGLPPSQTELETPPSDLRPAERASSPKPTPPPPSKTVRAAGSRTSRRSSPTPAPSTRKDWAWRASPSQQQRALPTPAPRPPAAARLQSEPKTAAGRSSAEPGKLALSIGHWISRGTLVVFLDGTPILTDDFSKKKLVPFHTTAWAPIDVPSGSHKLSAKVVSAKGKVYLSKPSAVSFSPGEEVDLRIGFKDDALTIQSKGE